jgi:hypothetical protein
MDRFEHTEFGHGSTPFAMVALWVERSALERKDQSGLLAEVHHQADGGEAATLMTPESWEPDQLRFHAVELST